MASLPKAFLFHAVTVTPRVGSGARGPASGAPVAVRGFRDDTETRVTTPAGTQMVSKATFYTTPEGCDGVDPMAIFLEGSDVVWTGGSGIVQSAAPRDDGNSGAWQHVEVRIG
ncbi:hypothetical protein [Tessaracoccus sp.]